MVPVGGSKPICFNPHALQHADKNIGKRVLPVGIEPQMLTVLDLNPPSAGMTGIFVVVCLLASPKGARVTRLELDVRPTLQRERALAGHHLVHIHFTNPALRTNASRSSNVNVPSPQAASRIRAPEGIRICAIMRCRHSRTNGKWSALSKKVD